MLLQMSAKKFSATKNCKKLHRMIRVWH